MGKKTDRILLYAGLGLLALLIAADVLLPAAVYPPYTSYSSDPDGTLAVFLLLSREGWAAARLTTPAPDGRGLMILVEPGGFTDRDWRHVGRWVAAGNTLFLADDQPDYLERAWGFNLVPGRAATVPVDSADPLLQDVRRLRLTGGARLKRASVVRNRAAVALAGDSRGLFLAEVKMGGGRVVLLTDPDLLTNGTIGRADDLILVLNVVRRYGGRGIWFNEAAHGYTPARTKRSAFAWPLGLTAVQAALAVLLLFLFLGKRFGRPVPLPGPSNRLTGEYVSSLARLYRQGRARHLIMESILERFADDLRRRVGAPRTLAAGELAAVLERLPDGKKLAGLVTRGEMLLRKPEPGEAELVSIAREMAQGQTQSFLRGETHGQ